MIDVEKRSVVFTYSTFEEGRLSLRLMLVLPAVGSSPRNSRMTQFFLSPLVY